MAVKDFSEQIEDLDDPVESYLREDGYRFMQRIEEADKEAMKTSEIEELVDGDISAARLMKAYEEIYDSELRQLNDLGRGYVWDLDILTSQEGYDQLKNHLEPDS